MKKILTIVLFILLPCSLWAWGAMAMSGGVSAPAAGFCSGSELFCEDFEGDDTAWDSTNGTADCDGYDADGDYCDDEATTYKNGSQAIGFRGNDTYYVREAFTGSSEFYYEFWVRASYVGNSFAFFNIVNAGGYAFTGMYQSWGTVSVIHKGSVTTATSMTTFTANTWYHVGVYYKQETGTNNGVSRVWMNTDGSAFDAGDVVLSSTTQDTGTSGENGSASGIKLCGGVTSVNTFYDDAKIVSGEPAWAY